MTENDARRNFQRGNLERKNFPSIFFIVLFSRVCVCVCGCDLSLLCSHTRKEKHTRERNRNTAMTATKWDADEVLPGLFLGSEDAAQNRRGMEEHGITHVLVVGYGLSSPFPGVCFSLFLSPSCSHSHSFTCESNRCSNISPFLRSTLLFKTWSFSFSLSL